LYPFEVVVIEPAGLESQWSTHQTELRASTRQRGRAFVSCEVPVERNKVKIIVRMREGFVMDAGQTIGLEGCVIPRTDNGGQDIETDVNCWHRLPTLRAGHPMAIFDHDLTREHGRVSSGMHYQVLVRFDLSCGCPKFRGLFEPWQALLDEEAELKRVIELVDETEILDHVCKQQTQWGGSNAEFLCQVAERRIEALETLEQRNSTPLTQRRGDDVATRVYESMCSFFIDRIIGAQWAKRRKEIEKRLRELTQAATTPNSKRQRTSGGGSDGTWELAPGKDALYRSAAAVLKPVQVVSYDAETTLYLVTWERQTERRRLEHPNGGGPLRAEECRIGAAGGVPSAMGARVIYKDPDPDGSGEEKATIMKFHQSADELDDDGVPRVTIQLERHTSASRLKDPTST
jgi:hypothetical protein